MSASPRTQTFEVGLATVREIWSSGLQPDQAMSARGNALRQARGQFTSHSSNLHQYGSGCAL